MEGKTYKVYRHVCPDGMIYVGVTSTKLNERWRPSHYKDISLYSYIEKFGWDNIKHEVIYTCDDREEALEIEDEMIQYWREKGCCINKQRSGLIVVSDVKGYMKAWNNEHAVELRAYMKIYDKARRSTPERKIYNRVYDYNRYYPDNITITPMQAKLNYIQYNIVPSFIKHDDIEGIVQTSTTDQLPLFNECIMKFDSYVCDSSFFNIDTSIETEQAQLF